MTKQYIIEFCTGTRDEALSVLGAAGIVAVTVMPSADGSPDHFDVVITGDDVPAATVALMDSPLADAWTEIVEAEAVNEASTL